MESGPPSNVMRSLKVLSGRAYLFAESLKTSIFSIFAFVFSCATISTLAGKEDVAAGVVAVSMRIDDERDRLADHRLDLVQNRLAIVGKLRVDDHDTICCEKDRSVSSTAGNHVETVRDFLDRADRPQTGATTA